MDLRQVKAGLASPPGQVFLGVLSAVLLVLLMMVAVDAPFYYGLDAIGDDLMHRLGALTKLGDSKWYLVPTGVAAIVLALIRPRLRARRDVLACTWLLWVAGFVFLAIASSGLLAVALKYLLGRARPKLLEDLGPLEFEPLALDSDFAGMPSGHANTIFALGLALCFLLPRLRVLWLTLAAWIALSRVLIDAHYLSDVVAGGLLAAWTTYAWRNALARRRILFARDRHGHVVLRGRRLMRRRARDARMRIAALRRRIGDTAALRMVDAPDVWRLAPAVPGVRNRPLAMTAVPVLPGVPGAPASTPLAAAAQPEPAEVAVSVVVPVRDEAPNIVPLLEEIHTALQAEPSFEVVYVDDGSRDGTAEALRLARARHPRLRLLRHAESCGQSAALRTGILAARGRIVVTIDGDGQNDPADIPRLLAALRDPARPAALAMVAGQRQIRRDSWAKRQASAVANRVRSRLLGDGSRDAGCGLKAIQRDVFLALPYFDHMHRFLPALVRREGKVVAFVDVSHRPRQRGRSKYGILDRLWSGVIDLFGVAWLMHRRRPPSVVEE